MMTAADKYHSTSFIKAANSRGLKDDNDRENPYFKSQYNDDRDLANFEKDQIFRHQVRAVNDNDDIDPSDSEVRLHSMDCIQFFSMKIEHHFGLQ